MRTYCIEIDNMESRRTKNEPFQNTKTDYMYLCISYLILISYIVFCLMEWYYIYSAPV